MNQEVSQPLQVINGFKILYRIIEDIGKIDRVLEVQLRDVGNWQGLNAANTSTNNIAVSIWQRTIKVAVVRSGGVRTSIETNKAERVWCKKMVRNLL